MGILPLRQASPSWAFTVVCIGILVGRAGATVRLVPESYPTIQAAVDESSGLDTISVAGGTYVGVGNRDINFRGKSLRLLSREGPEQTIIDCQQAGRAFVLENLEWRPIVDGFSVINGRTTEPGGAVAAWAATPTFRHCVFIHNQSQGGGAVLLGASAVFEDCAFLGNMETHNGGGAVWALFDSPLFKNCVFSGNLAYSGNGGALRIDAATVRFVNCTITHNMSNHRSGGIYSVAGPIVLERTICRDNCADGTGDEIYAQQSVTIECSDIDTLGIDAWEVIYGDGVIDVDPIYCDPVVCANATANGDYTLRSDSPCLPGGNVCQVLIGALDMGCQAPASGACCLEAGNCVVVTESACEAMHGRYLGDGTTCESNPCAPTAVEPTTWGRIRASFR